MWIIYISTYNDLIVQRQALGKLKTTSIYIYIYLSVCSILFWNLSRDPREGTFMNDQNFKKLTSTKFDFHSIKKNLTKLTTFLMKSAIFVCLQCMQREIEKSLVLYILSVISCDPKFTTVQCFTLQCT